jgi:hypothetical protein
MGNLRRLLPTRQLDLGLCGLRLNELDRGLFRSIFSTLRQKHDAMIGTAQVLEQRELPVDNLAFAFFPAVGHRAPPVRFQITKHHHTLAVPLAILYGGSGRHLVTWPESGRPAGGSPRRGVGQSH